jgi:hypothetical protein
MFYFLTLVTLGILGTPNYFIIIPVPSNIVI